jgi:hypothetical protein
MEFTGQFNKERLQSATWRLLSAICRLPVNSVHQADTRIGIA